jgi:hypothetical protein
MIVACGFDSRYPQFMFETAPTTQPTDPTSVMPRVDRSRVALRWGEDVTRAGYQPLPDALLIHQTELGLRSEDLNVLLHLLMHWHEADRMPFPRPTTIAKRMGVSERSVQRSLTRMRKFGILGKQRFRNEDGRQAFDLRPLIERLTPLARRRLVLSGAGQSGSGSSTG